MEKLSLQQHLNELRNRVIFSALFFIVAFCICYFFAEEIYQFLLQPLAESFNDNENRRII